MDHKGLTSSGRFTWKHHHVLKIPADFVPSAQVQEERERVDVRGSSQEDGYLIAPCG